MQRVAIIAARRTAVGTFGGMFANTSAVELGIQSLKGALADSGVAPASVDEVIVGNILSAGLGQNVARQIAVGAGIPFETSSYTVNKLCGSGLKSVALGAGAIMLGEAEIVAAGGTESMSQAPYALPTARYGAGIGHTQLLDLVIHDALWDKFNDYHMGVTAENLADAYGISREEMDLFAVESQRKAEAAITAGRFKEEIVPIEIPRNRQAPLLADTDEHPRFGTTVEALARLKPAFRPDGRVTAGNSSGINDGAAFVVLAGEEKARRLGLAPIAYIRSWATVGVDPAIMGIGPVPASRKALAAAELELRDIDLVELNEAFAAQSLAVLAGFEQELGTLGRERLNVNGGAIALGHPVGASGARILVTLVHEMRRRSARRGLATLCIGGGQGIAMVVEGP